MSNVSNVFCIFDAEEETQYIIKKGDVKFDMENIEQLGLDVEQFEQYCKATFGGEPCRNKDGEEFKLTFIPGFRTVFASFGNEWSGKAVEVAYAEYFDTL